MSKTFRLAAAAVLLAIGIAGVPVYGDSYHYAGRTAAFFGDSLTEENYQHSKGYHQWLQELLGLASYENYGVRGYTTGNIYHCLQNSGTRAEVLFIMGGTNDQTFDLPLGTPEDTTEGTTWGNLRLLCGELKEHYADRQIIFITPPYQTAFPHSQGITHTQIGEVILALCEEYGFQVYDNGARSGICEETLWEMTNDGCHWNDRTHEKVGRQLAEWLTEEPEKE